MPSTPYVRGTKTVRITTARLVTGNAVLTASYRDGGLYPAQSRTGSIVRTVARVDFATVTDRHGRSHRTGGRRVVLFDDGSTAPNLAAHQTWAVLADTVKA